jgi:serine/threonine protein kinase
VNHQSNHNVNLIKPRAADPPELETTVQSSVHNMQAAATSLAHKKNSPRQIGKYRLEEVIGSGSMSVVHRATETTTGRVVAIKISNSLTSYRRLTTWFEREIQILSKLQHPNICALLDSGVTDGRKYIVMPLVEGNTLTEFVDRQNAISIKQIIKIVKSVAGALQHAHENGIVHRDLKPANIILGKDGKSTLIDFGLASLQEPDGDGVKERDIVGTPAYMSPEQVKGDYDQIGPQSDIHALGVIMYQLLTCRLPFNGSISTIFEKILDKQPNRPSRFRGRLQPELEQICMKAMSKAPQRRHYSAKDLIAEITDFEVRNQKRRELRVERRQVADTTQPTPNGRRTPQTGPKQSVTRRLPENNSFSAFHGSILGAGAATILLALSLMLSWKPVAPIQKTVSNVSGRQSVEATQPTENRKQSDILPLKSSKTQHHDLPVEPQGNLIGLEQRIAQASETVAQLFADVDAIAPSTNQVAQYAPRNPPVQLIADAAATGQVTIEEFPVEESSNAIIANPAWSDNTSILSTRVEIPFSK